MYVNKGVRATVVLQQIEGLRERVHGHRCEFVVDHNHFLTRLCDFDCDFALIWRQNSKGLR